MLLTGHRLRVARCLACVLCLEPPTMEAISQVKPVYPVYTLRFRLLLENLSIYLAEHTGIAEREMAL